MGSFIEKRVLPSVTSPEGIIGGAGAPATQTYETLRADKDMFSPPPDIPNSADPSAAPPTEGDAAAEAAKNARAERKRRRGRAANILTSGQGLLNQGKVRRASLGSR